MVSLDRRLNPLYAIKECSSCGNLHTKDCGCPKGSLEDKILVPVPDLSQRPLKIEKKFVSIVETGSMVYTCRQCALIRKTLEEVFQDFQDTSKSSNDDTNFVNQVHSLSKQGHGVNLRKSSQINTHCAHYGYNCPPQIPIISKPEPCNNQTVNEFPQTLPSVQPTSCTGDENSFTYDSKPNFVDDSPNVFNPPLQPPIYSCEFCGNDARYGHYCTPQVPFIYPEPDEFIKSSVENLVPIPSESEGIPDSVCDVPLCNNPTPLEAFKEHSETIIDSNDDSTSSDDDSYENIDYVDASPPDAEIVSLLLASLEMVIRKLEG
ncbi:hypothetical protein Tco_1503516 [Tanacetum coccineum]